MPRSHWLQPVMRMTCWLLRRLAAFCSVSPVQKCSASSNQTATSGVMWGRPSARTVAIQLSSAASSASLASSQLVGVAPGSLQAALSVVVGVVVMGLLPVVSENRKS